MEDEIDISVPSDSTPETPRVQFEEGRQPYISAERKPSAAASAVMKYSGGAIKNEKQANYVLIGIAVVVILAAGFIFFSGGESSIEGTEHSPSEGFGGRELPDSFR